uniref:Uncharacterized protein n=1 Tax=Moniliophthora roreri TaxID=221103 RepID=A0A0W0FHS2_MONRR
MILNTNLQSICATVINLLPGQDSREICRKSLSQLQYQELGSNAKLGVSEDYQCQPIDCPFRMKPRRKVEMAMPIQANPAGVNLKIRTACRVYNLIVKPWIIITPPPPVFGPT